MNSSAGSVRRHSEASGSSQRRTMPISTQRPRVFISYRWESQAHMDWVSWLAQSFLARAVAVVLDQFEPPLDSDPDVRSWSQREGAIARLVHRMATCHAFIPVFTPGYLERVGYQAGRPKKATEQGWVFDEFQQSLVLGSQRRIETIAILREGDFNDLPSPFHEGNALDLRADDNYDRKLDGVALYLHERRAVPYVADPPPEREFWQD